ncbi:hypothetical protein I553_2413 [Mycobacterium xenopi 4042]|uniref:Uncharacterized protein n=1 Tax=Mycobacterium xenopi 4042 TaxID=1299334 RepID=X8C795_MYCXE|nr:hypothetical protein I553_2413 [Mycobacterium xenopi 4042]
MFPRLPAGLATLTRVIIGDGSHRSRTGLRARPASRLRELPLLSGLSCLHSPRVARVATKRRQN